LSTKTEAVRGSAPMTDEAGRRWILVDGEGQTLGRLSTFVARVLMGKHTPRYEPHADRGDFVVVINAGKVRLTGRKAEQKLYRWHTGYPGGLKQIAAGRLLGDKPERVLEWAVQGMLPKTRLGRRQAMKLKVYAGPDHPHQAQQPERVAVPA
jgi:large subunit ribosomal protein L13